MYSYKLNINDFVFNSLKAIIWLLLIFGFSFTKINVIGPLFLYDIVLLTLFLISILKFKLPKRDKSILLFIVISLFYLFLSFLMGDGIVYTLRQFMIVGYFIMAYFIFQKISYRTNEFVDFIFYISKVAFVLQLGYFIIILIKGQSLFGDFNYLSPVSIMLLPVYATRILVYETNKFKRYGKVFFVLVVSTMVGHSSAFLAVFVTILLYFLLNTSVKNVLISLGSVFLIMLLVYNFVPQFRDVNANWRIFYWNVGIKNTVDTYLLGNRFGTPFISDIQIQEMVDTFGNDNDLLSSEEEPYYKAFHNSFVTLFFHLGIFILLIMKPIYLSINRIILGHNSKRTNFLIISLLSVSIWASFNVVLELPHSSLLFWAIYFLTLFNFNNEKNQ